MKEIKEYFQEVLEEYKEKLFEAAYKKKEAERAIVSIGETLGEHLVKIALYPNHSSVNHWIKEVLTYMRKADKYTLKGNKRFKKDQYFEFLYETPWVPEENFKKEIIGQIATYEDLNPCMKQGIDKKAEKVKKEVKKLLLQLSEDLAKNTFDPFKYKEILKKYKEKFLEDCNE